MSIAKIHTHSLSRNGLRVLTGLALATVLIPVAAKAAATDSAIVDDFESGSNQNKFLGYSFFYNDSKDGGTTTVNSSSPGTIAGELLFDKVKSIGEGANGSKSSAKLDFTFGTTKPIAASCACPYGQMAGFGTGFVAAGKVLNLTGATSVTFWAKASVATTLRVEIATKTVTNFGYHLSAPILTTSWMPYTIPLVEGPGFAQPGWATTAPNVPVVFDPSQVEKIQFAVSKDDNGTITSGVVYIDDIVVHGYKWVPPNACVTCEGVGTGALLSNMETPPTNQNKVGGYWYAYNDAEGRGDLLSTQYSEIFAGVGPVDPVAPTTPKIAISATKGEANSAGAYIGFNLGPAYTKAGTTEAIQPFVGVGTKVSDALGTMFTDMTGSTGISFSYSTDVGSTFEYLRLEAKSNRSYTNTGIIHAVLLPATNGVFKSVVVPWAKLVLPDWNEVAQIPTAEQTLKFSEMEKFQWAVQGAPGTKGGFAIDNVKIEGMATLKPLAGIFGSASKARNGFSVAQGLHGVQVALRLNETEKNATIRLIDMKGNIVATQAVSGNGLQTAELGKANLPSGVYSVQVNLGNRQLSTPVTVLP